MLRPVFFTTYIDSKQTVALVVGGKPLGDRVHKFFKCPPLHVVAALSWVCGLWLLLLSLLGRVGLHVGVVGGLLGYPTLLLIWLSFNTHILSH